MAKRKKAKGALRQASRKPSKVRIKQLVEEAIQGIQRRLSDNETPPTIGDYLKVMQLQKDIEEEAPKEIKVTWVEPEKIQTPDSER